MEARRLLLWAGALVFLLTLIGLIALVAPAKTAPVNSSSVVLAANRDTAPPVGGGATAMPSPVACTVNYTYTVSSDVMVISSNLVAGSQCGRCVVPLTLPFPV